MATNLPDSDSEDELPPGWEERATADGSVYYVNHASKGSQWIHPRTGKKKRISQEMPYGWEKVIDEQGLVYFKDTETNRTTFTDPRLAFAMEEKEHPEDFRQRFDGSSTALQVLHGRDLSGRVAIVTGANCGIGFETARSLALHGCTVIFACRNVESAEMAVARVRSERPSVNCHVMHLDLQSLQSVKNFVEAFKQTYKCLDMLILNAGVFGLPFTLTPDGFETTFQVNHLSHFYLTILLEPQLSSARAKGSRVVVLSSESHRFTSLTAETLTESVLSPKSAAQYRSMSAYDLSKLCNVAFAIELAHRWRNKNISVFAVHPGNMINTDLSRHWWLYRLVFGLVRMFTKSLQQGASTTVYCATALDLAGCTGYYFNNCCVCNPSASAQDPHVSSSLWSMSFNMVYSVMGPDAFDQS